MTKRSRAQKLPGTIYRNGRRWWWKVRLPGENCVQARALRPPGAKYATNDRNVAYEIARDMYARALAEQEPPTEGQRDKPMTVGELAAAYRAHARSYYRHADGSPTSEYNCITFALRPLMSRWASASAETFTPKDLKVYRDGLIESGLARTTINQNVNHVRRFFRWATAEGLVPPSVLAGLQALPGLRRNRSKAREPQPVKPIAEEYVLRTCEYLSPVVSAMVRVQLYTGMRSGELVQLRPIDVDTTGEIWQYRPPHHKTAYRGHTRVVPLGPRAQEALAPFLSGRAVDAYCFSPAEAEAWRRAEQHRRRKTPLKQGNRPGTNRLENPSKKPGDYYDATSYRKAVEKAIKKANKEIATAVQKEMAGANKEYIQAEIERRRLPHWTPHRLRHTAATRIRKDFGLDAARAVLGQRTLAIADRYAEIDQPIAEAAAKKLG